MGPVSFIDIMEARVIGDRRRLSRLVLERCLHDYRVSNATGWAMLGVWHDSVDGEQIADAASDLYARLEAGGFPSSRLIAEWGHDDIKIRAPFVFSHGMPRADAERLSSLFRQSFFLVCRGEPGDSIVAIHRGREEHIREFDPERIIEVLEFAFGSPFYLDYPAQSYLQECLENAVGGPVENRLPWGQVEGA
jgi:hypothetical protein